MKSLGQLGLKKENFHLVSSLQSGMEVEADAEAASVDTVVDLKLVLDSKKGCYN